MCNLFSFCSNGKGKYYYFNWKQRQELLKSNPKNYNADSHTSIADFYGFTPDQEDGLNKYEFNPLTKIFCKYKINLNDDSDQAEKWVNGIDFKNIVKPLIIKPTINYLIFYKKRTVTKKDIKNLKLWASVRASVWYSVWDSVSASVRASVRDSVWDSVGDSVGASVWYSIWYSVSASIRASVRASVWDSVGASVWDSIWYSVWGSVRDYFWAYYSTFFNIKYKHNFKIILRLLDKGLIPSFDGKIWRIHSGKKSEIVWEGEL
jgi:hypothetical protein